MHVLEREQVVARPLEARSDRNARYRLRLPVVPIRRQSRIEGWEAAFGQLARRLIVARDLERIFAYRQEAVGHLLG